MISPSNYGDLQLNELSDAARLAVIASHLRGLQALGPNTPLHHAIYISFDPQVQGVHYPKWLPGSTTSSVTIVLQYEYSELRVDWQGLSVVLTFYGQAYRIRIPFVAISRINDGESGFQLRLPAAKTSSDFLAAFRYALATLMTFQWRSQATDAELEGRAMFGLPPALLARTASAASKDAPSCVIVFQGDWEGVSLPRSLPVTTQLMMSLTLSPRDEDAEILSDKVTIECDSAEGDRIVVPFAALRGLRIPALSLYFPLFPGPLADYYPNPAEQPSNTLAEISDLGFFGQVTPPANFPPGSVVEKIWQTGKFCLSAYVGRYSIPGLQLPGDVRQCVPLGALSTLEIFIFDELSHNAAAFRSGSKYCVGLYHGLIITIPAFVTELWTRPDFMPWIGEVSRLPPVEHVTEFPAGLNFRELEKIARGDYTEKADQEQLLAKIRARSERAFRLVDAMDPIRKTAMQECIEEAFRYIWLHEIGHVVCGHVDLIQGETNAVGISEVDDSYCDPVSLEFSHFLEIQADRFAFNAVLNSRIDNLEAAMVNGGTSTPGRGMPRFVDQATIALVGCVVTLLVFAVYLRFQGRNDIAGTHPPVWFRVANMIFLARTKFDSLDLKTTAETSGEMSEFLKDRMDDSISSLINTHLVLIDAFESYPSGEDRG